MKPIHGVPSPNRRTIRTKEPVDRTIPSLGHFERSKRVDTLACAHYNGTQQSDQHHHWTLPQPNPLWIQPHAQLQQSLTNPQRVGRIAHTSAEQGRQSERPTPGTVPSPRTGLAGCIPLETPPSEG